MKTISLFVLFAAFGLAHAQQTPADVNNSLVAQVNVSRDQLKILAGQIGKGGTQTYSHADYHAKMAEFAIQVNATMSAFDTYLADSLLPVLQEDITNYNSVVRSKDYAPEQKAQTLNPVLQVINKKAQLLEPKYKEQVMKLYSLFADYARIACKVTPADTYYGTPETRTCDLATLSKFFTVFDTIGGSRYAVPKIDANPEVDVFQQHTLPLLMQGCRSYSCITLTAVDFGTLLSGIKSKLDRDLVITLADNKIVTIHAPAYNVTGTLAQLKNTTYTDEVLALPFDAKE